MLSWRTEMWGGRPRLVGLEDSDVGLQNSLMVQEDLGCGAGGPWVWGWRTGMWPWRTRSWGWRTEMRGWRTHLWGWRSGMWGRRTSAAPRLQKAFIAPVQEGVLGVEI